jgi:hypothetical protein
MRTFGNACTVRENMGQLNNTGVTNVSHDINANSNADVNLFSQMPHEIRSEHAVPLVESELYENHPMLEKQTKENGQSCPVAKMNDETDRYIRDIVLGGKFLCKGKPQDTKKHTDSEIDEYQNEFYEFKNKINNSSSEGLDMVDKLNEIFSSGNNELTHHNGKRISDVYNELTKSNSNNGCGEEKCILPPEIDRNLRTGFYTADSGMGKYYSNYNWKYENDNVNNGGKFYGNIEANDSNFDPQLLYKSKNGLN